jgi:hypothetical protein
MKKIMHVLLIFAVLGAGYTFYYAKTQPVVPQISTPPPPQNITPEPLAPQAGLPEVVEKTRQAIYIAALTRDYDKLAALATYPNFTYSFGMPYPEGFSGFLRIAAKDEGVSAFDIIPRLLKTPYAYSNQIYTWPGLFTKEPIKWTAEDIAVLKTFFTDEEIEKYRQYGGYLYYRLGINSKGEWIYYIAGD